MAVGAIDRTARLTEGTFKISHKKKAFVDTLKHFKNLGFSAHASVLKQYITRRETPLLKQDLKDKEAIGASPFESLSHCMDS